MLKRPSILSKTAVLLFLFLSVALSLEAAERHTLVMNGRSTEVLVIFVAGHPYVDLEALAKALNGSISSSGTVVALNLPDNSSNRAQSSTAPAATPSPSSSPSEPAPATQNFSRQFLSAAIEAASTLREWHTALQTAIESGIPLSEGLLQPYRAQATTSLRLASTAANTAADRNAYQLLNNVYLNMGNLADKYIKMRASLSYIAPNSLQNDELNRRIVACGHSLGAMAASGQFSDEPSCH